MKWILLLMLLTKALEESEASDSVRYIKSNDVKGDFWMADGKALQEEDSYLTLQGCSLHVCRSYCQMDFICHSVSAVQVLNEDHNYECHLSVKSPEVAHLVNNSLSVYMYWKDAVASEFHGFKDDNLLYLVPKSVEMSFSEARDFCAKIPGYRLAMLKTPIQYESLVHIHQELGKPDLWVDLAQEPDDSTNVFWGDGTPYGQDLPALDDANDDEFHFRMSDDSLADASGRRTYKILCQAHPLDGAL